jgi:hypothetical protein
MKSRSVVALSAATLLAAGVISASTASASHSPHAQKSPAFELIARQTSTTNLNLNKKGHQGDEFTFTESLTFRGSGVVGHDFGACTLVNGHSAQCLVTASFRGSTPSSLTVQGVIRFNKADNVLAVTGGTGEFEGVTGQVETTSVSNTKTVLDFDFVNPAPPMIFHH